MQTPSLRFVVDTMSRNALLTRIKSRGLSLLGMLAVVLVLGCQQNGNLGDVSGVVSLDGTPLADVVVSFTPKTGGRASIGQTDAEGKYRLIFSTTELGAQLGEHRVEILPADDEAPNMRVIPKKYQINSPLSAHVESGVNQIDFELKSKE
ncbi:carboxypeptidase regulatory-like domain-containing protein [Bremerella sp. P1]|uniref:carboxypeptidase regulatory-like domain-containing protein n=1 Tax=Bremerella sp. P1 TaxID=3026424 RepID=UPI002367C002|nr:carboxypeptidase regulatory-like domain-containing protein [Bremerella sp. P1]WDI41043.1 carboxypeptidase regulatory-like domain-containing protein [Bremerella sp. P1]